MKLRKSRHKLPDVLRVRAEQVRAVKVYVDAARVYAVGNIAANVLPSFHYEYVFSGVPLRQGRNVFTFAIEAKNPASKGFKTGLDCLVLEREGVVP